jgi:hypothetical protein
MIKIKHFQMYLKTLIIITKNNVKYKFCTDT